MYRLAPVYSVTDRRTDDSMMPIADHTACILTGWQWPP